MRQRWVNFSPGRVLYGAAAVFWGYVLVVLGAVIFAVILLWMVGILRP